MIVILSLSSDNVRNCEEIIDFMKEFEQSINCKKKGILSLLYKQGTLIEKCKECDKFQKMCKKNGASKTYESVRKVSKTQSGNKFK